MRSTFDVQVHASRPRAAGVVGALVREGLSDIDRNAWFLSATFTGMTVGAWLAGVLGDR